MGFEHQLLERLADVFAVRREALEQLLRRQDHLVGGFASAAFAAHAVGQNGHHATRRAVVLEHLDLVLLVRAVAPMDAGGRGKSITLGRYAHGRKL